MLMMMMMMGWGLGLGLGLGCTGLKPVTFLQDNFMVVVKWEEGRKEGRCM
ncbi:hypothetical protein Hanom_Chr11g00967831 [Helianthus anomalus]